MTTCFKTEVKRDEQLWKELQDSVYKESHLNTNLQTLTERVDRLEQGQRQKECYVEEGIAEPNRPTWKGSLAIWPSTLCRGTDRGGRKESVDKHS